MVPLLIRNGLSVLPEGLVRADILVRGPLIVAIGRDLEAPDALVLDATGLIVGPGFVDVHTHGGGGCSFFRPDPAQIYRYGAWAPRHGVTAFLASTGGQTRNRIESVLAALAPAVLVESDGAEPLGFHLEGPFLNPARKGAFPRSALRKPSVAAFRRYQEAAFGLIRQLTLAPELPGSLDVVRAATHGGTVAAMGHTDADLEAAAASFAAGVTHVTHLFNAMRPIHQRDGGAAVAALLENSVSCELICDGVHIAPEVLRFAYRLLGPARTCVVTDSVASAGQEDADAPLAPGEERRSGAATRRDGTIVGSLLPMDGHFRNVVEILGVSLPAAFRLCATNPARVAGVGRQKGRLQPGSDADIVLLNQELAVTVTVCRGRVAWDPGGLLGRSGRGQSA